jgi:hypothetical protein
MQSVNWADLATQASAEYVPIPVGSYTAIVTNAEATQSSTGKLMFVLQLHIVGGAHDGRTLRNNVVLTTTTPQAIEMFFRNMEALGLPRTFFQQQPQPTNELIAQKLINAYVQIEISHRAYNGRMTENVTVWDNEGILQRFESVEDLLVDWVNWRLDRYEDRRLALIKKLNVDIAWASMKIRFIRYYLANHKYFKETPDKELIATLVAEGFDRHSELLAMPMRNLTHDKIKELEKEVADLKAELASYESTDASSMFVSELKALKL